MSKYSILTKTQLTPKMLESLMEFHERELLNLEPYDVALAPSAKSLISRELVIVKPYVTAKGKSFLGVYVTDLGRKYLSQL